MSTAWWHSKPIRFQCQGSGKCCVTHGQYGYVYLTLVDRRRLAAHLGLRTASFTRRYCVFESGKGRRGVYRLKEDQGPNCIFLKGKQCGVYPGRPEQCRTWPFWPEVMEPKKWAKEVAKFCPGVGKGQVVDPAEIDRVLAEQGDWEERLVTTVRSASSRSL